MRPTCRWGQDQHRILYWTSPIDAPRRELSVDIPHVTRAAVARSPYNFRLYYDHSSLAPLALLAGNAQPGFNFSLVSTPLSGTNVESTQYGLSVQSSCETFFSSSIHHSCASSTRPWVFHSTSCDLTPACAHAVDGDERAERERGGASMVRPHKHTGVHATDVSIDQGRSKSDARTDA